MLGQNADATHTCSTDVKVFGFVNDLVEDTVKLPPQHLVEWLTVTRLWECVPGEDQLDIRTLKH